MAFDQLSIAFAGMAILLLAAYTAHTRLGFEGIPKSLPWVGKQDGFFADLRTRCGSLIDVNGLVRIGYRKYSKAGLSFVLPSFDRVFVLVPSSTIKWIVDQPDSVLESKIMQIETVQTDYTLLDPSLTRNPIHEVIIRRDLTRSLGVLIPDLHEELSVAVDEYWGKDTTKWVDIGVYDSMGKVVSRASNRIFVGLPLCRNDEYLNNSASFATDVGISSSILRMMPVILKPLLSWIVILPNRWHHYKSSKFLLPFVRQRMADLNNAREQNEKAEKAKDFTTWYLEEIANHPESERTVEKVVGRLMTVNFAAIHTSMFTATNVFFDLISSRNAAESIKEIRDEVSQVLSEHGGKWDKSAVAQLIKTDSAIRESLRISTFLSTGMDRKVVSPDGVTLPDGLHLPTGSRICTAPYAIHHDDSIYENAASYDPFRFSRVRGATANTNIPSDGLEGTDQKDLAKVLESKNLSIVTTSNTFLSFGHGRHACPGRFFAAAEMKLLLAYIVLNYDIKLLDKRPPNLYIGSAILPPMKATISVKRRQG